MGVHGRMGVQAGLLPVTVGVVIFFAIVRIDVGSCCLWYCQVLALPLSSEHGTYKKFKASFWLGIQVECLTTFEAVPSSLGSGLH